jgi:putative sterol carrier protein
MTTKDMIQGLIDKFHSKMEKDENARAEVARLSKSFNIDTGGSGYSLRLEDARIVSFDDALLDGADVTLAVSEDDLRSLIDGSLRPMRAYVTKRIRIAGSLEDLMFLRKFF